MRLSLELTQVLEGVEIAMRLVDQHHPPAHNGIGHPLRNAGFARPAWDLALIINAVGALPNVLENKLLPKLGMPPIVDFYKTRNAGIM